MRVQAGRPKIQILNATQIRVQKDSAAPLNAANFSASTNLNIDPKELEWFVADEPTEGISKYRNQKWQIIWRLCMKFNRFWLHMTPISAYFTSCIPKITGTERYSDIHYVSHAWYVYVK